LARKNHREKSSGARPLQPEVGQNPLKRFKSKMQKSIPFQKRFEIQNPKILNPGKRI
jgi:hypothetical protein